MQAASTRLTILLALGLFVAMSTSTWAQSYESAVLADSPIGYWRLGEASGPTAADETAGGRDLTYNGFPPGIFGQPGAIVGDADTAVDLTGTSPNPTISRGDTGDFGFASGQSFSVEYWIKAAPGHASSNDAGILGKGYDGTQVRPWYLSRLRTDEKVDFYLRNSSGTSKAATSSTQINDDQWHHVVGVYDNADAQVRIYVDGSMEHRTTGVPADAYGTNTRPFILGNHLNRRLDAALDEVALYDVALDNTDGTGGIDADNRVLAHSLAGNGWQPGPTLSVDFSSSINEGSGPGGLQEGFLPFDATEDDGTGPVTRTLPSGVGVGGTVDVTMAGYTHFRDYAGLTGAFAGESPLLSDMVLRNADGEMTLTFEDLLPGVYDIEMFHHSSEFGGGSFDIELADQLVLSGVPVSDGTSPSSISTTMLTFVTDGSAVRIDFLGGADPQHLSLNGFVLTRSVVIPEPCTLLIWFLLAGLAVGCGWRRRKR